MNETIEEVPATSETTDQILSDILLRLDDFQRLQTQFFNDTTVLLIFIAGVILGAITFKTLMDGGTRW